METGTDKFEFAYHTHCRYQFAIALLFDIQFLSICFDCSAVVQLKIEFFSFGTAPKKEATE